MTIQSDRLKTNSRGGGEGLKFSMQAILNEQDEFNLFLTLLLSTGNSFLRLYLSKGVISSDLSPVIVSLLYDEYTWIGLGLVLNWF